MNSKIADLIKAEIENLPFVDKIAGIVKPVTYTDKQGTEKTFPIALNDATACQPGHYMDLCPDSTKLSIIYFEDLGMDVVNACCYYTDVEAKLRLVCWINLAKINTAYSDANLIKWKLIQVIPRRLANSEWATKIFIKFAGEELKSPDIFAAYSYDEKQNQYLMFPFDYFALNYTIKYSISMDSDCLTDIILNPRLCT